MGSLFYHSEINFASINLFYLILAVFLATLLGSLIGFFLGSIAPDLRTTSSLAFFINTSSNFLAGVYVPMKIMLEKGSLSLIAKFFPYSYPVCIANRAFSHYKPSFIQGSLLFSTYHWPIVFCLI
jgi:ABC-type multidrug transport system permease subunit